MTTTTRDARSHEHLIRELEAQHSAFDRTLAEELRRPAPDALLVRRLKRAKLALKDRAAMLARPDASLPSPARG
ncbi:MAG: DUF465 domain-containing protein [Acetobacteraceae bacterium]|jgi:hypothetical protein|nr:DUF465 domain-containing protein [Acetobacteraceae bacterium]